MLVVHCIILTKSTTIYLVQELPGDKATQWDDFVSNALAEVNRKNEITPLPVRHVQYPPLGSSRCRNILSGAVICNCRLNLVLGMGRMQILSACEVIFSVWKC